MKSIKSYLRSSLSVSEEISHISAWLGGVLLFGAVFLISVEVILRKLFSISMGGADEISSYILAISCSWSFSYALFHKAHVRIDILYIKLNEKAQAVLDMLSLIALMVFMFPTCYYAIEVLKTSISQNSTANTPLQTPLWIPQAFWVFGLVGFAVVIVLLFLNALVHLLSNDISELKKMSGVTTLEENIKEESGISVKDLGEAMN